MVSAGNAPRETRVTPGKLVEPSKEKRERRGKDKGELKT